MKSLFCPLFSGSTGNSMVLKTSSKTILIDAGKTGKAINAGLDELNIEKVDAVVITHEHIDHTSAVGIISRKFDIPIYATEGTWKGMGKSIGKIESKNIKKIIPHREFFIGDIVVNAFNIPHDASEPVGYNFFVSKSKLSVATDIGCITQEVFDCISDSDVLLLESNHDVNMLRYGRYPWPLKQRILSNVGHLSNENAGKLLCELYNERLKYVILGHLSKENNFPELAYKTVKNILEGQGKLNKNLKLSVANASLISEAVPLEE